MLTHLRRSLFTPFKKVVDYAYRFDPWLTCSTATTQQRPWPRMALQLTCSGTLTYGSMPWSLDRSTCDPSSPVACHGRSTYDLDSVHAKVG